MRLTRQTEDSEQRSGRRRAAAWHSVSQGLLSHSRVVLLGLVCTILLASTAFASVASAAPGDLDSLKAQASELETQIADLDQQLEASTEAYNQLVIQLNELNVAMTMLRQQKDAAERDYEYRLRLYEQRLCDLYKAGGQDEFLQMILDASSMGEFIDRARLAAELADQDRRLMENLTRSADTLDEVIAQIDQTKTDELSVRRQMTGEKQHIETTLAARRSTLDSVSAEIAALIEAERQRQAEEQAMLQETLAAILNGGQVFSGTLPQTDSEILNQFLETAAAYMGVPYVWGGERPSTGLDCSGYTQYVYRQHGISLPHYSGYQAVLGLPVDLASIQPGDLLAFGFPVHHVGIYVGEDLFLHAAGTGLGVRIGRLSDRSDLAAIRRFDLKPRSGAPAFN